ncbi:uncharacterized protein BP5553_08591 [Venustampulla echinocandica]|uniref:Uncharacterized protein n=1 Tax=Venustampulla echinocandica TaxID=2656787 RepID=A0A370TEM7_9HELO|nr:uncharacterized protein BP5553_08591 [Venustampulla echinocandica]RDL33152.1 hypothetical protein BP5553_08591 [Venustampulla echinocandica]
MSSKRETTSAVQGATKACRASRLVTPGPMLPRNVDSDDSYESSEVPDELNKVITRNVQKFDISAFP